ncbi:hypothetical protein DAPPUDRAFT_260678 [Daphnia pulex]|uniref:Tc1-like transposase DDE domain-containing protein n=1 Tax=Daphnia pulex TaxID=6669 RepID=E9HJN5_DAPPU|nr:hypothetical protein DAPPUDRAFT_260678 [Daphnia pulex]|eukprot:EFX68057.1 hypothetical protein DAPPUDRAFT_260678 [Daphnia pulex]
MSVFSSLKHEADERLSSVHNSRTNQQWLAEHQEILALDWPKKGADMNPIENVWGHLVVALNKSRYEQGLPFHARDANGADELFAQLK